MSENTQSYGPPGPDAVPPTASPSAPPPPPPAAPAVPRPPLRRSRTDRKVAGVCGGLAAYLGIDPVILRVVAVVLAVFGGSGLLLYAVGWLLVPEEGTDTSEGQRFIDRNGLGVGIVVAVLAVILLLGVGGGLAGGWWFGGGPDVWPLLVIGGIGFAVWFVARDRNTRVQAAPPSPPAPSGPSPSTEYAMPYAPPAASDATLPGTPLDAPYAAPPAPPLPAPPPPAPKPRSVLGLLTVSVAAIVAGVLVALDLTGEWDVDPVVLLAVLTGLVGLGLVVGAFVGRSRGLIALGVVLALCTAGAAAIPGQVSRSAGDVVWAPATLAQLEPSYEWGAGNVTLDLSDVQLDGRRRVTVDLGAGELSVLLPPDVTAEVSASTGVGSIVVPEAGINEGGLGRDIETILTPAAGTEPAGTYVLDLNVGLGELEVRRAAS